MDLFAFIHASDPTNVRVVEREREVDEPWPLDTTVGRTVPLLQVAPNRADSELEASVERLLMKVVVAPKRSKWIPPGRLLVGAVLNVEVKVMAIPTLPFVTASVSTTLECEDEDHTDSVAEPNLGTIGAPQSFIISLDSSHHSGLTIAEAKVDSLVRSYTPVMTTATTVTSMVDSTLVAKDGTVKPSLFATDSYSAGGADPNTGVFSNLSGSDFLVGGIRTVIDPDTDLQKVYVPQ
nr:hypothetical protein [Tanacetum cinerariifolium]